MNVPDNVLEEYCMNMFNVCNTLPKNIDVEGNVKVDFGMVQAIYLDKILAWDSFSGYHGNFTSVPKDCEVVDVNSMPY